MKASLSIIQRKSLSDPFHILYKSGSFLPSTNCQSRLNGCNRRGGGRRCDHSKVSGHVTVICVNVKNLKIFVAGVGVDAAAVQHRAGVGDVRGGCGDQSGGLLHSGQRPRPHRDGEVARAQM